METCKHEHFSALLADKGCDLGDADNAQNVTTPSIGFFGSAAGSGGDSVPEDLATIVMNKLIVLAQTTASYNVATSDKVTAVSNAKVRRTSEIDWDSLASGEHCDDEANGGGGGGGKPPSEGGGAEEEQMMKMFQERQALEGKGGASSKKR